MASLSGDLRSSFDYFDEFLKNHNRETVEDEIEIIEEIDEESSSSYYEEEIIEDNILRDQIRLSTVHENDESYSDEDNSDTDMLWEEVSQSFNCGSSDNADDGDNDNADDGDSDNADDGDSDNADDGERTEELETNSDMIARVRNILRGGDYMNYQNEGSLGDSSSRYSGSDDGGSSSVLPDGFDFGSYHESDLHSSDEDEDEPLDYEQACRDMITTVHPHLDPNTMLHGCEMKNLYTNLKQQYRHILRNTSASAKNDDNMPEPLEEKPVMTEDEDVNKFVELSFKSNSERQNDSHGDMVVPDLIPDDSGVEDTNKIPAVELSNYVSDIGKQNNKQVATDPTVETIRWVERDADDPEDYEAACRLLCQCMYNEHDPDYDVETMFRRSTPKDLYRYLKPHYWYLVHTNQLDENGIYRYISNYTDEQGDEEKQPHDGDMDVDEPNMTTGELPTSPRSDKVNYQLSNNVESLRSLFSTRSETLGQSERETGPTSSETTNNIMEMQHEEKSPDDCRQALVMEKNEENGDDGASLVDDESKTEMQCLKDESSRIEESPLSPNENSYDHNEERSIQNSLNDGTVSPPAEKESSVYSDTDEIEMDEPCSDEDSDDLDETKESAQEINIENSMNNRTMSPLTQESSVESDTDEVDMDEPCGDETSDGLDETKESAQETNIENSLNNSTMSPLTQESSVQSDTDGLDETKESAQETNIENSINNSTMSPLTQESSVQSDTDEVDVDEPCGDETSDGLDETKESAQETNIENSMNNSTMSPPAEKESSVYSDRDEVGLDEPYSDKDSDDLDETKESAQETNIENSLNNRTMSPPAEKKSSVYNDTDEVDVDEPCSDETSDGLDETKESPQEINIENSMNNRTMSPPAEKESSVQSDTDEVDVDEPCGDETSDGLDEIKESAQETNIENSLNNSTMSPPAEKESSVQSDTDEVDMDEPYSDKDSDDLDEIKESALETNIENGLGNSTRSPPAEKESSVYSDTDEVDMDEPCSDKDSDDLDEIKESPQETNIENSLNNSTMSPPTENESAVHQSIPIGRDELNLAQSGDSRSEDGHELILEKDSLIENNNSSLSLKHLQDERSEMQVNDKEAQRPMVDPKELAWRKMKIQEDLKSIIEETEEEELHESISAEIVHALTVGSLKTAFTKKYYHPIEQDYVYYPSVAKAMHNFSLIEEAEKVFHDEFSFDLSTALCTIAASRMKGDINEVDENDIAVIEATEIVVLDNEIEGSSDDDHEENQSEKYRDFSMTKDTVSMMSSLVNGSSLTAEALTDVNEECSSSDRQCETKNIDEDSDCKDEEFVIAKDLVENHVDKEKVCDDVNALEELQKTDNTKVSEETNEQKDDQGIDEAALYENESLLTEKYLEDRRKIDQALVDLESELVSELNRLDNEANECRLKHKVEEERIRKDRKGIEDQSLADESKMGEQAEALLEKLRNAVEVLESERDKTSMEAEMVGIETAESKNWGWFNNKTRKNSLEKEKQKQEIMMKFKLKEIELEKDINDIKAQLDLLKQQAKAKKRNIFEWQAELNEEYRHLEDLTSATQEKLKEEMRHLQASYEQERKRLLEEKNNLELTRPEDYKWIASGKDKSSKDATGEDSLSKSNKPSVPAENTHSDGKDSASESDAADIPQDEPMDTTDVFCNEDDTMRSDATETAEEILSRDRPVENDSNLIRIDAIESKDDGSSTKNDSCLIPDHLASLNQPRELQDEDSLRSFDLFDSPEGGDDSSSSVSASRQKKKSEEDTEARASKEEARAITVPIASQDRPKQSQDEVVVRASGALDLSKGKEFSSKKFLAAALKGKQESLKALPAGVETATKSTKEEKVDFIARSPGRSLSEMRRKVEEARERAIAIRNGDSSSRHSRSTSNENESLGDASLPTRQPQHPIYPMIRETDRLSGFIRRYERKLETVCKSLLTLASVTGEEKEILAARQLALPEMLEYVVKQDWYKAHSTSPKSTGAPQFVFSKAKNSGENDSVDDNRYSITTTGKLFLEIDGPDPSDVGRFLAYLNRIEEGLSKDDMVAQWKEIALLSGDEQSQRVCDKLDKLISFCVDSRMVTK